MVNSDDEVPFFKLSLDGCKTELLKLVNDKKLIRDYQQKKFWLLFKTFKYWKTNKPLY